MSWETIFLIVRVAILFIYFYWLDHSEGKGEVKKNG